MKTNNNERHQKARHMNVSFFDYKDFKQLQKFVDQYGKIMPRKRTGLTERQQKELAKAIKRARHLALMPFVASA